MPINWLHKLWPTKTGYENSIGHMLHSDDSRNNTVWFSFSRVNGKLR